MGRPIGQQTKRVILGDQDLAETDEVHAHNDHVPMVLAAVLKLSALWSKYVT